MLDQSSDVRRRIKRQDIAADVADASRGNDIVRNVVANLGTEACHAGGCVDAGVAQVCGQRVVDFDAVLGEGFAAAKVERRSVGNDGIGSRFAEAFVASEDEILVLADRATDCRAELMRVVLAASLAMSIVLDGVGVENGVMEILEDRAMPRVGARLERSADDSAARAAELSVVSVGEDLELFDGVHGGRVLPFSSQADGSAVEQELIGALDASVDDEGGVDIEATQVDETAGSELFLREDHAGREADERVGLTADQRQLFELRWIPAITAGGSGCLQLFAVG